MRTLVATLLAVYPVLAQAATPFDPVINLDRPGVLERIERDDPARHRKIVEVLRASQAQPCDRVPAWMKIQHRVSCGNYQLLTSYPAKTHVTFAVEGTTYVSNVVQTNLDAKSLPVAASK